MIRGTKGVIGLAKARTRKEYSAVAAAVQIKLNLSNEIVGFISNEIVGFN
jgi:hypothetical protein